MIQLTIIIVAAMGVLTSASPLNHNRKESSVMAFNNKPNCFEKSIGEKFNKLTVVEFFRLDGKGRMKVRCACECGGSTESDWGNVKSGRKKSCGCIAKDSENHWNRRHGLAKRSGVTKVYRTYCRILSRCYNPRVPSFKDYGGRGIVMCSGFREKDGVGPAKFAKVMGEPITPLHEVDRIDNDGNYSCGECEQCIQNGWPLNVRWSTDQVQSNHRRTTKWVTLHGEKMSAADAARKIGIPHQTLIARITSLGWDEKRALTTPVRSRKS